MTEYHQVPQYSCLQSDISEQLSHPGAKVKVGTQKRRNGKFCEIIYVSPHIDSSGTSLPLGGPSDETTFDLDVKNRNGIPTEKENNMSLTVRTESSLMEDKVQWNLHRGGSSNLARLG